MLEISDLRSAHAADFLCIQGGRFGFRIRPLCVIEISHPSSVDVRSLAARIVEILHLRSVDSSGLGPLQYACVRLRIYTGRAFEISGACGEYV